MSEFYGYDNSGHGLVLLQAVSIQTDNSTGKKYGVLNVNATFSASTLGINDVNTPANTLKVLADGSINVNGSFAPAANQRVNAQAGDFVDGSLVTLGAKTDAKNTATDATAITIMQVLKQISFMLQNPASTPVTGTITETNSAAILASLDDGQENMANSISICVASDQSNVPTQNKVGASGGSIPYHNLSAATANFTNVKGSACQLYSVRISNTSASVVYFKVYDKATTPGTGDTPKDTLMVNANTLVIVALPEGMQFSTGFGWAATAAVADNDNTAISANVVIDFSLNS